MDINQKFFDDVIISLMEMNDRLVALEEMAAEHVAEHEAAELSAQIEEQNAIFAGKKHNTEEMINIIEEYHYKDGEISKKVILDFPKETIAKTAFLSGNGVIGAEIENKFTQPAPEVEPTTEDSKNELEQVEQASETIRSHMKKWGMIAFTIHSGEIA
ncbi:hypothetical protein LCU68_003976 [Salmonella enterica]|nr:hypothetical protein [Salmonella enterica]